MVELCLHLIQRSHTAALAALRYLSPSVRLSLLSSSLPIIGKPSQIRLHAELGELAPPRVGLRS